MKGIIKNRKTVALAITKTKLAGVNPDKHFAKEIGSRMLYHNSEKLTVTANNRKNPDCTFARVKLPNGTYIWTATNKAAEEYLRKLPENELLAFITHVNPPVTEQPESRRVVVGRPVKALPKGHREGDYFNEDGSLTSPEVKKLERVKHKKHVTHTRVTADESTDEALPPGYMDQLRNAISQNVTQFSS